MNMIITSTKKYLFYFAGIVGLLILLEISQRTKTYIINILSVVHVSEFVKENLSGYLGFTFTTLPIFLVEILLPNDETSKDHKNGLLFWLICVQFNFFIGLLSIEIVNYFNIAPLFNLSFNSISSTSFLNPLLLNFFLLVLSLLVFDFFYYWFHRTQHTISFFWEFHKVHHSIKNLNAIVSYHHVLEELFRIPFIFLPLAMLIHIDAPKLAILSSFYAAYGVFIHMNARISLGHLRYIFADNYYHRIHHSVEKHHYNKNYAAFFPIWDILFKTAIFPKNNEFPKVGLDDMEQPKNLKEYFFSPKIFKRN
jgi:sterol desaturase/sphingolipid hydroxylase (fatty acid hydroxylase superfamily)